VLDAGAAGAASLSASVSPSGTAADDAMMAALDLPAAASAGWPSTAIIRTVILDRDRLAAIMRSYGYYDAGVTVRIRGRPFEGARDWRLAEDLGSGKAAIQVAFEPAAGPLYHIRSIRVRAGGGERENLAPLPPAALASFIGMPAAAATLASIEAAVSRRFWNKGFGLARVTQRLVTPDRSSGTVDATIVVAPGPAAVMGPVSFIGSGMRKEDFSRYVQFKAGDPYNPEDLGRLRAALRRLPSISSANLDMARAPDLHGQLPVQVTLFDRPVVAPLTWPDIARALVLALTAAAVALRYMKGGPRQLGPACWVLIGASSVVIALQLLTLAGA
jgi:translocation and assembly module TamA